MVYYTHNSTVNNLREMHLESWNTKEDVYKIKNVQMPNTDYLVLDMESERYHNSARFTMQTPLPKLFVKSMNSKGFFLKTKLENLVNKEVVAVQKSDSDEIVALRSLREPREPYLI